MDIFSVLLALCESTDHRPLTGSFDVFFELRLDKWLNKQSKRRWFDMPSRLSWRHCNDPGDHGLLNYMDYNSRVPL